MNNLIDLHTHSFISDGSCSPSNLIKAAYKNNIKAIALTDHDSIKGIKEASIMAKNHNIELISGIEISAVYRDNRILHILGLGIDLTNEIFLESYYKMKKARESSIPNILKYIKENQNLDIDVDILRERKLDEYLSRYDIYRYIIDNKICTDGQKIWNIYLDPIPYGPNELISINETLKIINKANGLSFLAHYNKKIGLKGFNKFEIEEHIKYLISLGLNGVERYYPSFSNDDHNFLDYLIDKYNLISCGGSDYHGSNRRNLDIGIADGNFSVPYELYFNIIKTLNSMNKY
ncbi:PHP domain-containing protein [Clostridium carnis]